MNTNIVDLVKDYLTNHLKNKIAKAINNDTALTYSAIDAVVPGLLNSFLNASTNPSRSAATFTSVSNQNGAILNSLDEILSTNNYIQLASTGTNVLTNTIGSTVTNNLADAVSNHSGLGKGSSASLLGLLTPVVLAMLKQQLLDSGDFSARNLIDMLNWQRDNIQKALPLSFLSLDERPATLKTSLSDTQTKPHQASPHSNSFSETVDKDSSKNTSFLLTKLMPLLLFSGILLLTYTLLYKKDNDPNANATSTSLTQIQETHSDPRNINEIATGEQFHATNTQKKKIENEIAQNLQEELQHSIGYVADSLGKINNVTSAQTAVEEITKATKRINELAESTKSMPLSVKKLLAEQVNRNIPRLQALTKNANDIPEVGEIIKPAIQELAASLTKFL